MITTPSLKDIRFLYKSLNYNNRFDKHVLRQQRKRKFNALLATKRLA